MFDTITRHGSDVASHELRVDDRCRRACASAILTALLVVPLWYFTPALPSPRRSAVVAALPLPPPPPPPPPPAAALTRQARHEPAKPTPSTDRFAAPIEVPSRIEPESQPHSRHDRRGRRREEGESRRRRRGNCRGTVIVVAPAASTAGSAAGKAGSSLGSVGRSGSAPALISRVDPVWQSPGAQREDRHSQKPRWGETGR